MRQRSISSTITVHRASYANTCCEIGTLTRPRTILELKAFVGGTVFRQPDLQFTSQTCHDRPYFQSVLFFPQGSSPRLVTRHLRGIFSPSQLPDLVRLFLIVNFLKAIQRTFGLCRCRKCVGKASSMMFETRSEF